jgi:hypothetical protein
MKNRLIWLLLAVIAFDFGITLLGQPSSYWHDPNTANEGTPAFKWFMVRGIVCYGAFILAYIISVAALIRVLPRQIAIITGLVFLLSHYFAASTWLSFHFNLGMMGPILYAVALATVLISILQSGGANLCANHVAQSTPSTGRG